MAERCIQSLTLSSLENLIKLKKDRLVGIDFNSNKNQLNYTPSPKYFPERAFPLKNCC
jgi:hypothetical protein